MNINRFEAKKGKKGHYIDPVFGVPIFSGDKRAVLKLITGKMSKKAYGMPLFVVTLNAEMLVNSDYDMSYKNVLKSADLLIPDGNGLRLLGANNIYPGRKIVKDILDMKKYRLMYMSLDDDLAWEKGMQSGSKAMKKKFGGEAVGVNDLKKINKFKPDLLLVALGAPEQEKWIYKNKDKLKVKVVIGIGGAFDYLLGLRFLPPGWMESLGLEWLWRLITQPWRWRRQTKLIKFVWKVLSSKF